MNGMLLPTLVLTVAAVAFAMLALAIGLLAGRRPLRGSCGRGGTEGCPCDRSRRPCGPGGEK